MLGLAAKSGHMSRRLEILVLGIHPWISIFEYLERSMGPTQKYAYGTTFFW
jgi:hypothetical protein